MLEAFPGEADGALAYGHLREARDDATGALEAFDAASRLSPKNPEGLLGQARQLARLGRPDDARTHLDQVRRGTWPLAEDLDARIQEVERLLR
jgi:Flp pilus assembly protein TadD